MYCSLKRCVRLSSSEHSMVMNTSKTIETPPFKVGAEGRQQHNADEDKCHIENLLD